MISAVPPLLAQQIVASIKDVCGYDINFISTSGVIFASTNPARIGTHADKRHQTATASSSERVQKSHDAAALKNKIVLPQ